MRRIAVFTATRAEYGLLYWLMKDIQADQELSLQTIVSGSHLSPEFGNTIRYIQEDGFDVDARVEMLVSSDTASGVVKSMGLGLIGYADELSRLRPDVMVVLGDRYEALAAAQAAMILDIPVLHLHGGEITEGAYDDSVRHAITKLSNVHCVATEVYRRRVIQMGEQPDRVFNVGAMGLDHLRRTQFTTRAALSESLAFDLSDSYMMFTYHPATRDAESGSSSVQQVLGALDSFPSHRVIMTYPNADNGSHAIARHLETFAEQRPQRVLLTESLGHTRYLSALAHADVAIGNSSSGIIEAPALEVPTVNIGTRQRGRLAARSVLHCRAAKAEITETIHQALAMKAAADKSVYSNPYGSGDASARVVSVLKTMALDSVKRFHNLAMDESEQS